MNSPHTYTPARRVLGDAGRRFEEWLQHPRRSLFEDSNLVGAARHAICLCGLVRTFGHVRDSFEHTLFQHNSVDVFFHVFVGDISRGSTFPDASNGSPEARTIARSVLTLPRRAVAVERWAAPVLESMDKTVPRLRLCGVNASCRSAFASRYDQGASGTVLHVVSQWRKRSLCHDMLTQHEQRHKHTYAAVVAARLDLHLPPRPLDLDRVAAVSSRLHAVLVPAGADMPVFNDQVALGSRRAMKPYLQAYQWCAEQKSMPESQLRATCGGSKVLLAALERSGVGVRRFWWQYWIVRSKDVAHLAAYPATFHLAFYSIACWQTLTFKQPAARLNASVFVHLNTSCSCDPASLEGYPGNGALGTLGELRQWCDYEGDFCGRCAYPSVCKTDRGPPPGHACAMGNVSACNASAQTTHTCGTRAPQRPAGSRLRDPLVLAWMAPCIATMVVLLLAATVRHVAAVPLYGSPAERAVT